MNNGYLLWVDDEIELLKAHVMFLEKKGYKVKTATRNGAKNIIVYTAKIYTYGGGAH